MGRHYSKRAKAATETRGNTESADPRKRPSLLAPTAIGAPSKAHDIGRCSNGERACVLQGHAWYVLTRISVGLLEARNAGRAFENPRSADGTKPARAVVGFQAFVELVASTFTPSDPRVIGIDWADIWSLLVHHRITSDWPGHGVTTYIEIDADRLAASIKDARATKARAVEIAERNLKAYREQCSGNDISGQPPTAPDFESWYAKAGKVRASGPRVRADDLYAPHKDRPVMAKRV
jgi:hypothetical protein